MTFAAPIDPFVGVDDEPAPLWEQRLMAATTREEVAAALALRDAVRGGRPVRAYSPDQARDERGRFGEGDGGVAVLERPIDDGTAAMLARLAEPDGGMTYDPLTGTEPTEGYVVAVEGHSQAVPADEFTASRDAAREAVKEYARANAEALSAPGAMMGLWHNPDTGNVVMDVVEVLADRDEAIRLGAERDQIAIYGIAEGEVIPTGGSGGGQAAAERRRPDGRAAAQAGVGDGRRRAGRLGADGRRRRARAAAHQVARQAAPARRRRRIRRSVAARKPGRAGTEARRAARLLERLARIRRDTARRLLAGAEVAFAEALRHAEVRVYNKAKNRSGSAMARTAAETLRAGTSIRPVLAALGMNESDVLAGAFGSYEAQAQAWLDAAADDQRQALEDEGLDPDEFLPDTDEGRAAAAAFLAAALLALARQRILAGQDAVGSLTGPGEVSGAIPAQLAAQALRIADGTVHVTMAESPDLIPTLAAVQGRGSLEATVAEALRDRLRDTLRAELVLKEPAEREAAEREVEDAWPGMTEGVEYVWVHGFYGDPVTVFEPHAALDGLTTTDPEHDEQFYNDETPWLEELYYPGDHLGCTCELVAQVGTGPAGAADLVDAARAAAVNGVRLAYSEDQPRDERGRFGTGSGDDGPAERTDSGYGGGSVSAREEIDDEWGEGTYDHWAETAPPGVGFDTWNAYEFYRDDLGPSAAIAMAAQAVAAGYAPSGAAALDRLEPDEQAVREGYFASMDWLYGHYGPAGPVNEAIEERLADPELTDAERAALEAGAEQLRDTEGLQAMADGVLGELREAVSEPVVTYQPVASVAAMLETGVIGNEAMFGGRVGNYTGDPRADAEAARIGVPHDAPAEDRPVYATTLGGDAELDQMMSGVGVWFGECRVDLDPEVLGRSTVGLGDLLQVPGSIPVRDLATLDPARDYERILSAASQPFLANAYLEAADRLTGGLVADALGEIAGDNPEWDYPRAEQFVEVQVHGGLGLGDVTGIGLPPVADYEYLVDHGLGARDDAAGDAAQAMVESREFVSLYQEVAAARGDTIPSVYDYSDSLNERMDFGL